MDFIPGPPRAEIVRPAAQWSHSVPTYMPWAHQNNSAQFIRFQGGQMPIVPGPLMSPHVPHLPADFYIHPDDPCSSRAPPQVQGTIPYPAFPSTSYRMPRFKRKMVNDNLDQIPAKQLVTEHMLERLNGLSLQDPCSSGYVPSKTSANPPALKDLVSVDESFDIADSKVLTNSKMGSDTSTELIFTDVIKEIQQSHLHVSSLEERLALNEAKKSTMALVPWRPPLLPVVSDSENKFDEFRQSSRKSQDDDCEASMEM